MMLALLRVRLDSKLSFKKNLMPKVYLRPKKRDIMVKKWYIQPWKCYILVMKTVGRSCNTQDRSNISIISYPGNFVMVYLQWQEIFNDFK